MTIDEVILKDGTPGMVWPLLPTDRARLAEEFEKLSPETRRHRFLAPVVHLSDAMLKQLVDDVDGIDHVALVLVAEVEEDVYDPVGIARMVRYPETPDAADLAVTVRDAWQGRGVATALLDVLARRRPEGVTHVITEVACDNPASLAMLRRLGPTQTKDNGFGAYDVIVDLDGNGPHPEADEATTRLHSALAGPRRADLRMRDLVCSWFAPVGEPASREREAEEETPEEIAAEVQAIEDQLLR
ncbi:MAG: GNAT family N-acetyltransferase [Nocardioides sp.]|nr:GNAT family N-acetyltransferase [Nocardioides sp.]